MKIILFVLLLVSYFSTAQIKDYKIYSLPEEAGSVKILSLYQNKHGYILIGTTKGLYKFDGVNFYLFTQRADSPVEVTAIGETKSGITWLGFSNGQLAQLNKNTIVMLNPEEGNPHVAIKKIVEDDAGIVWFATSGEGLYYYYNKRFYNVNVDDGLSDDYVYDITFKKGVGVIAATDKGINICNLANGRKEIRYYTSKNGLPDNIVRSVSADQQYCWLAMQDAGLGSYNLKNKKITANVTGSNWSYGQVNCILATLNNIWAATDENGLLCLNTSGSSGTLFVSKQNKALKKLTSLLQDTEGNIWAAGNNQLVRVVGATLRTVYTFSAPSSDDLHTLIHTSSGEIWFNKIQQLTRLSPSINGGWTEKKYSFKGISANADITSLYEDINGNIWIGTMGSGILLLDPLTGKYRTITEDSLLLKGSILSISGRQNTVWVSSLEGAVSCKVTKGNSIDKTLLCKDYTAIEGLGTTYIYDIYTDLKKRVWFATDGKGLIALIDGRFINFSKQKTIENEVIYKIAEDASGNIWFSTLKNGLVKFNGNTFTSYSIKNGLSSLDITSLTASQNLIFIPHQNGIDIFNTSNSTFTYLDAEQGINNVNGDINTITKDEKGNIYFVDNFNILQYNTQEQLQQKPAILIDQVQLYLKDIDATNGYTFASNENNISFSFTGLFYSHPEKIQYQYKLEGLDDHWINTKDRIKNFPQLPPGNYTFRVRAALNKNFSNADEASFKFFIRKPFYLTYWFIIGCFLLLAGSFYFIVKRREKRVKKLSRLENEKIQLQFETLRNQVNPHFLFNSFNALISEIENDPEKAVSYVEHLSDFYRSIVVYREKDLIKLEEELAIMKDYFFIQQKRYGKAFLTEIAVSGEDASKFFVAPLTLQLLAENAVKHNAISSETPLKLNMHIEDDYLIIANNINPKMQTEKSSGLGLQNIEKRYALLANKPVVIEKAEKLFVVKIPLIKIENDKIITDRR